MINQIKNNIEISLILLFGLIFRLFSSLIHGYSNDELSAINRIQFNTFDVLFEKAVMKGDMHPAGVQLFETYWSKLFGFNEFAMRFPFVIMGTLSIWLIYRIGAKWISKQSGLIAATLMSLLFFTILNTEFARPYSPGLLFSLLSAHYLLKLLFEKQDNKWLISLGLSLSITAAMYTHYFAFMFVGFISLTGLFFLKRETILPYLAAGTLSILLFLPHLSITIYHLTIDGGLQWLGKPSNYWLLEFLYYAFNSSLFVIITLTTLILWTKFQQKEKSRNRFHLLFLFWFLGIFIVGLIFTYISSPILKFPVMLFPLPFLFLFISSAFRNSNPTSFRAQLIILTLTLSFSTIYETKLFQNIHFGLFKEPAEKLVEWSKKYGDDVPVYINVSNPNYLNFYAAQIGDSIDFNMSVLEFSDHITVRNKLVGETSEYCIVGYSSRLTLPNIFETCREFYPNIIDYAAGENWGVFLLHKNKKGIQIDARKSIAKFGRDFRTGKWKFTENQFFNKKYQLDSANIYGPDCTIKNSFISGYFNIFIEAEIAKQGELTATFTAKRDGQDVLNNASEKLWIGENLEQQLNSDGTALFTVMLPPELKINDEITFSFWNRNGQKVFIKSIHIVHIDNPWL